jgi:DNA-binding transcriptional regulator YdaS (Cro superfamily)
MVNCIPMDTGLERVIGHFGNKSAMATALQIARQAIQQWDRVPVNRVLEIERMTGIPRTELRPDIYPPEQRA